MTGSTPSSSTTRAVVVGQVTRLKKWVDDGIIQIAGQGLSPEQLFTSGKCSTFFASTAAHGSIERDAKIKWSATYLPHEEDLTRAQQQHRRRHDVGDEGPQGRGVRRGRRLPRLRRQPRPAALVAQGDGLRADHQQGLPARQGRGLLQGATRRARSPSCSSIAARRRPTRRASTSATTRRPPSRCARRWNRCSPTRRRRSRGSTTRCAAATRSCASSRSSMQASTSVSQ